MWYVCLLLVLVLCPAPAAAVTMAWDNPTAPGAGTGTIVIQRSLNKATWQDVASVPLASGTTTTWTDPAPPTPATPSVMEYRVLTSMGVVRSEPSNTITVAVGGAPRVPQSALKALSADSEESLGGNGNKANAIDGIPGTLWHTVWSTTPGPRPPHWIILDLGGAMAVDGLSYLPRQDGMNGGTIGQYEIAVSMDARDWGTPVSTGTWTWPAHVEQLVRFPATQGRYVRLTALREYQDRAWTSAAEIGVYAAPRDTPPGGTCTDGIKNGTETGIDCGGSCPACPASPLPSGLSCTGTLTTDAAGIKTLTTTCTYP